MLHGLPLLGLVLADALTVPATPVPAPRPDYLTELHLYFDGEVKGAQVFVAAGAATAVAAALFAISDSDELRGASVPVGAVALVQLGVGIGLWWRTEGQVADLVASYGADPARARAAEAQRMARIDRSFALVEALEVAIMAAGIGLSAAGGVAHEPVVSGVGLGLVGQSVLMLTMDMFADDRADRWASAIEASR